MSGERDPDSGEIIPEGGSSPFPNPTETALDYDAQALARVALQYRQSPRFLATVSMLMAPFQALEDCLVSIPPLDDPVVATGENLNVTGDLVGQGRVLSEGTSFSDANYRILIAMRIVRNKAIASGPEMVAFLIFVFQTYPGTATPFRYYDSGGMVIGIEYGGGAAPNAVQIALLGDGLGVATDPAAVSASPIMRAMAVGIMREWYDPDEWFGFAEDTRVGAKGFGLESDPSVGGRLAMLF